MDILHARRAVLVAATALLASACSSAPYYPEEGNGVDVTRLEVTNHNWMDVTVYAVNYSQRVRMGTVTSGTTERFKLPSGFNVSGGQVRLQADPVGSSEVFVSEPITMTPGTTIVWRVENHMALSNHYIRSTF